jgi:hypothetical protein
MHSKIEPYNSRDTTQLTVNLIKSRRVEFCRGMHSISLYINSIKTRKLKILMIHVFYDMNRLLVR